jgi:hypothetical protein
MKFSQIAAQDTYDFGNGVFRRVDAICPKTNEIAFTESGKSGKMPGQKFAKEAKRKHRDRSNDKPKEERRVHN